MKYLGILLLLVVVYFNQNDYKSIRGEQSEKITVEIKGEVLNPGVYELNYLDTLATLLEKSGGMLSDGDVSNLNQNLPLKHKDVIVVPSKQDMNQKVSLNSATLEQLCTLPGVGEATANAIIEYRTNHGSFHTLEDLMKVKGIKQKTFDKLFELLAL